VTVRARWRWYKESRKWRLRDARVHALFFHHLYSHLLFDEVYRHGELLALKRSGTCFVLMTPAMPTVRDRTDTNANDIEDARFKGWSACAAAMRSHDEDMVKNWKEEIDTLLLLVCY
jgi:hypothetical protein